MENDVVQTQTEETKVEKKGYSIASMVLALSGLLLFAIPCGILAVIFSGIGIKQGGKGFATTGLVVGIIDIVFGVINLITTITALGSII